MGVLATDKGLYRVEKGKRGWERARLTWCPETGQIASKSGEGFNGPLVQFG